MLGDIMAQQAARKIGKKTGAETIASEVADGYRALLMEVQQKTAPAVPVKAFFARYAADLSALLDRGWTLEALHAETAAGLDGMPLTAFRRHAAAAVSAHARAPEKQSRRGRGRPRKNPLPMSAAAPATALEMPAPTTPDAHAAAVVEPVEHAPVVTPDAVADYVGRTVEIVAIFDGAAPHVDGMSRDGNRLIARGPSDRAEVARARLAALGATEITVNVVAADDVVSRPL